MNNSTINPSVTEKAENFHALSQRLRQQFITHWWIIFLTVSLGILLQVVLTMRLQNYVFSEGKLISSSLLANPEGSGISNNGNQGDFFATQLVELKSPEIGRKAEERVRITNPGLAPEPVDLEVEQQEHSDLIVLTAKSKNGAYAQAWLAAVMDEYLEGRRQRFANPVDKTVAEMKKDLDASKEKITRQIDLIAAWKKRYNDVALVEQDNGAALYLTKLKQTLAQNETEFQLLEMLNVEQNANRLKQINPADSDILKNRDNAQFGGVAQKYLDAVEYCQDLLAQKAELSEVLKPKHPKIVALNAEISRQQKKMDVFRDQSKEEIRNQRESLRLQIENNKREIKEWEVKALEISGRLGEYKQLQTTLEQANADSKIISDKITAISSSVRTTQDFMQIYSQASDPKPYKRGLFKSLLIGILGGLVVGVGILLLINQLDDRIRSFSEMQAAFDHPVIGHVPRAPLGDHPLISEDDDRHMLLESLRNIRSSIFFMPHTGAKPKTLLVTSSIPNEGKSTVSSNLAITMAMSGAKTLLIDADMRRGALHTLFETPAQPGLADYLTEKSKIDDIIFPTKVKNLSILSRGRGTSAANDLLLGKQTDTLIKKLYPHYDYIILDSAPVLAADDTSNLAPKMDGVIFVLRASFTPARLARRTLEILLGRQVHILGLVFNCASSGSADYPYYRYEEYHTSSAA